MAREWSVTTESVKRSSERIGELVSKHQTGTALHRWKLFHRYGMFCAIKLSLSIVETPSWIRRKSLHILNASVKLA